MTLFHIATVDEMASQVQGFRGNRTSVDGRAFAAAVRATPFGAMLFVRPCLETLHVDFVTQANLWAGMHLTQYQTVVGASRASHGGYGPPHAGHGPPHGPPAFSLACSFLLLFLSFPVFRK